MESGYYNHEPSSPRNMESLRDRLSREGEVRTRGTTLLSIHLFRFLCLLPAFFSTVSTIWVSPLQTDSMPGSSNAMLDPVGYSIRYFDLTSLGSGAGPAIFALGNGANKQIKAFDQTGILQGTLSPASQVQTSAFPRGLIVKIFGANAILISAGDTGLVSFNIAWSAGTYTLTYSSTVSFSTLVSGAFTLVWPWLISPGDPATNYIFYQGEISYNPSGVKFIRTVRVDMGGGTLSSLNPSSSEVSFGSDWSSNCALDGSLWYRNPFQIRYLTATTLITSCYTKVIFFDAASNDLPFQKYMVNPAGEGSNLLVDNLNSNTFYASAYQDAGGARPLDSVNIAATPANGNFVTNFATLNTVPYARGGMLNFGNFAYLGVVGRLGVRARLFMVDKFTFLEFGSNFAGGEELAQSGESVMELGATDAFQTGPIEFTFAFSSSAGNNGIYFHKVVFELCEARDPTTKICSACPANTYLSNGSGGNVCLYERDIPHGSGRKISPPGPIEPCTQAGCKNCRADSTVCNDPLCDISQGYVVGSALSNPTVATGVCVLRKDLPSGFGADTTSFSVRPCASSDCDICRDDYTSCNFCKSGFFLDETSVTRTCLAVASIPLGNGRDVTTTASFQCMEGCLQCNAPLTECTQCDQPSNYYLDTNKKTCILISEIPPRFGPELSSGNVAPCSDANCLSCPQSTLTCAKCDMSIGFFLDTSAGTCILTSSAPTQQGADYSSGQFKPCSLGCSDCSLDFNVCLKCLTSLSWYRDPVSFKCLQKPSFAKGEGVDNLTGDIRRCSDPGCVSCRDDYKTCIECEPLLFLNSTLAECVPKAVLGVASVQFIKSSLKAFVVFKQKILTKDYLSLADVTFLDGNGNPFTDYSNLVISLINSGDTLLITMNFTSSIVNGRMLIKNKPNVAYAFETDNGVAFPLTETVTVPNIVFFAQSAQLTGSVEAGGAIVKSFSSTAKIILVGVSPAASVVLDKIGSYFSYLQYLDGPTVIFPDLVLSMLSDGDILPWKFPPNLFVPWAENECTPKQRYADQEADCNILVNYGPKLIVIATIILFSTLLLLVRFPVKLCLSCKRKSLALAHSQVLPSADSETSQANPAPYAVVPDTKSGDHPEQAGGSMKKSAVQTDAFDLERAQQEEKDPLLDDPCFRFFLRFQLNYGFKYLMVFMEGVCLEACGYAVVNLFTVDRSPQQVAGAVVSVLVLLYYAYYGYMVTEYVSAMNRVKRKERRFQARNARLQRALTRRAGLAARDSAADTDAPGDSAAEDRPDKVKHSSPVLRILEGHTYSLVDYTVDEYKPHLAREWYYFTPVFVVVKNVLLQLTAYALSGTGHTQLVAVTLLESLAGAYAIASRVNEKPVENFLDGMNSVLYVCYLLMKMATLSEEMQEDTRQKSLGLPMAAVLVVIVLVNVVFISVVAMRELWGRAKILYKRWKEKKSKIQASQSQASKTTTVINLDPSHELNRRELNLASGKHHYQKNYFEKPEVQQSIIQQKDIVDSLLGSNLFASTTTSGTVPNTQHVRVVPNTVRRRVLKVKAVFLKK